MRRRHFCAAVAFILLGSCRRPPAPLIAQTSGTFEASVAAPTRIVRDRWGIPHLYAASQDDLFFAQGFVQAQDRLFQMDLWRRSAQGRLAEILGPNFIERDAMTRRMQYAGDLDAEWASYGSDAKAIASAFVRGVNGWVAIAQAHPPEEFVLAGWRPEFWSPLDLLNRTDAFIASGDAVDEVARRRFSPVVADAIRRVGTRPFLAGSRQAPGIVREHPSLRYLVHLHAPKWNVIGATAPWRPGIAVGHNDRVAWDMEPASLDTQDLYVDSADAPTRIVDDALQVKGRASLFAFNREFTAHGVVVAADRERRLVYSLRWSGFEPGAAPELAAIALDRARSSQEFREALKRWKMPARRITYAAFDGLRAFQEAALVPVRHGDEWIDWMTLDDLPHGRAANEEQRETGSQQRDMSPVLFAHVLATTDALRKRFSVGPLTASTSHPPFYVAADLRDWDRSNAMNAPGQSGSASSAHFSDLAAIWSAGREVPLAFSDHAVQAGTETTLVLIPKK